MDLPALAGRLGLVVALLASVALLARLGRPRATLARVRRRLLLGLPWGTLTSAALVLAVYLFVQGGWGHWYDPVVVAYRSWSYLYPLGILTASFAHVGPGHLLGNLFGALALGTLAEYAVGHFPRDRGVQTFTTARTNPYVRAFVLLPAAVVVAGVFAAAFAVGPVVGFSGVVFALGGFALAYYPLGTVLALVAADALRLGYRAVRNPVTVASGRPAFVTPWWADIAIQGHALGFVLGVVVAIALQRRRGDGGPGAGRLWAGATLFAVAQSLWAVYWFRGGGTFVLFRGAGLAAALVLALLVAVAVAAPDRPFLPRVWDDVGDDAGRVQRWVARRWPPTSARVAFLALTVVLAALAGPAVPVNLVTTAGDDLPNESLSVRDYDVTYAENVESGMVSVFDGDLFGNLTSVNTSGVVVRSSDRHVWTTAVTTGRLSFAGRVRVTLGGLGWRRTVVAEREGWTAVGGGPAYRVSLSVGPRTVVPFLSDPARADPRPAGHNVSVAAETEAFLLVVETDNRTVRTPLPGANESVTVANVTFVGGEDEVVAVTPDGTEVTVFTRETYRGQQG